ncbi:MULTISPECIES: hypothetical protein [Pseudomonadati]|uniref:Uncharacterized protein n=1 Tax=Shewanella aestuarii TaxID=1028752 RepID=A0ABT0KYJ0_9GAMM|nr:hypothetical protein [Shewanella aestuarii]MCL1116511.1 hypothetical protein [Shewanella aestuarii]GGN71843.1 hypothetical protein GCM10009193_08160 [Shewanella aestuarii]
MKTAIQTSSEAPKTIAEECELLTLELSKLELEKLKLSKVVLYLKLVQLIIFIPLGAVLLVLMARNWDQLLQLLG